MHADFLKFCSRLNPLLDELISMEPVTNGVFPRSVPKRGVYLFSDSDRSHLYVGRSNDIRVRYGKHCLPGATHRMAAFAFRLARESTGRVKPSYQPGPDSRKGLMEDPEFRTAFKAAKRRIRNMDFRYVEEQDPIRQCLLEIYVAIVLGTPYNSFETH